MEFGTCECQFSDYVAFQGVIGQKALKIYKYNANIMSYVQPWVWSIFEEFKEAGTEGLSTSKAEYIATTLSACQAVWLRRLLADLNDKQGGTIEIFCNNISTIAMTKGPKFS